MNKSEAPITLCSITCSCVERGDGTDTVKLFEPNLPGAPSHPDAVVVLGVTGEDINLSDGGSSEGEIQVWLTAGECRRLGDALLKRVAEANS